MRGLWDVAFRLVDDETFALKQKHPFRICVCVCAESTSIITLRTEIIIGVFALLYKYQDGLEREHENMIRSTLNFAKKQNGIEFAVQGQHTHTRN